MPSPVRVFLKWFGRTLLLLVPLVLVAAAAGYLWLRTSLPETDGRIALAGLGAPAEIARDADGLVTIRAQNQQDAAFALGFAHAQDRLFQMDLTRRLGAGRLSEIVGPATLDIDKLMRVLGLYRLAEANLRFLAPEVRAELEAYSAGVNAYLTSHKGALPPEYYLLRTRPEPWRPADTLVWGRLMAWQLSGNWRDEILRAALSKRLTPAQLDSLWPALSVGGGGAALDAAQPATIGLASADLPLGSPWLPIPPGESNNWVVSGRLTASGKPLLANDPHLSLGAPIQWYLARIETPRGTLAGATAPGGPFMVIGHNGHVAWGFTTTQSDTQDLFIEKLAPGAGDRYETPSGPRPFATRQEVIRVRGAADIALTVRSSDHGPVLSDIGVAAGVVGPGQVAALAWPGLRENDMTAQALYRMNHAADAAQFREALRDFQSPQQNVVYADRGGAIGFMAAGLVPIRKALYVGSQMPVPGWSGAFDWTGFIPFEALPQSVDPASGWLATANNKIVGDGYPYFIAARWEEPYRRRRIGELLDGRAGLTVADMQAMQMDDLSPAARELLPLMLADLPRDLDARTAAVLPLLRGWDFRAARDLPQPLIFTAWLKELARAVYADELGALYPAYWFWRTPELRALLAGKSELPWCDDVATPAVKEDCAQRVGLALSRAVAALAAAYGDDPSRWRWGAAHQAHFANRIYESIPGLDWLLDYAIATDGDNFTLNRGTPALLPDSVAFPHVHGAGLRAVFDLADLNRSRFIIATGQSGNPLSPHYADLITRWRDGRFLTMVGGTVSVLTLTPR